MRLERIDATGPDWSEDPRLRDYRLVREPDRLMASDVFLAEGRRIVRTLLVRSPYAARSILATEAAWTWLVRAVPDAPADLPVFVLPAQAMRALSGHRFHQGCLAAGARPAPLDAEGLLAGLPEPPRCVVALDGVSDPDNVGAIFRSAAALGAQALVLSGACCSPLYRKAIRTSMGASLWLPFSHGPHWAEDLAALARHGLTRVALSPRADARPLEAVRAGLGPDARVALLMGAEGAGLGAPALAAADVHARIPLLPDVDSLNVAAAAAIALYRLCGPSGRR